MGRYSSDAPVKKGSVKDLFFSSSKKSSKHSGAQGVSATTVLASTSKRRPVLAAIAVPTAAVATVAVAGFVGAPEDAATETAVAVPEEHTQQPSDTEQPTVDPAESQIVKDAKKASEKKPEAGSSQIKTKAAEANKESGSKKSSSGSGSSKTNDDVSSESSGGMTSPAENKAYAKSVLSASDFQCANELVMRESGWKTDATNPSSGAYGVPQSLPGTKMASEGSDWRTNGKTQFNWMIKYVDSQYGGFCQALSHSHAKGWY